MFYTFTLVVGTFPLVTALEVRKTINLVSIKSFCIFGYLVLYVECSPLNSNSRGPTKFDLIMRCSNYEFAFRGLFSIVNVTTAGQWKAVFPTFLESKFHNPRHQIMKIKSLHSNQLIKTYSCEHERDAYNHS